MEQERIEQLRIAGRKGGLISGGRLRKLALERYYSNPLYCKFCGKVIEVRDNEAPSGTRKRCFCNSSCSASYNNQRRTRKKKVRFCLYCGEETTNHKFCNTKCSAAFRQESLWREFDEQEIFVSAGRAVKNYLIARRGPRCEICSLEEWRGLPIGLILDHIDGNANNNNRNNLRIICPNCDSQLPTYKGRNYGNGRYNRRKRYQEGKSY